MRKFILSTVFAAALSGSVFAQGADITGVIGSQIEAFKVDDFATAFTFASPSIQGIFRTPENFGRMVSEGYPMVWRPAEVEYLNLREERGVPTQRVRIVDSDGGIHLLDYFMLETPDGWKINGVQYVPQPDMSA